MKDERPGRQDPGHRLEDRVRAMNVQIDSEGYPPHHGFEGTGAFDRHSALPYRSTLPAPIAFTPAERFYTFDHQLTSLQYRRFFNDGTLGYGA